MGGGSTDGRKKPPSRTAFIPRIKTHSPVETEAWQVRSRIASRWKRAMRVSAGLSGGEQPEFARLREVAAFMLTKSMARADLPVGCGGLGLERDAPAKFGLSAEKVAGSGVKGEPSRKVLLLYSVIAAGAFHLAWEFPVLNVLALIYAWALIRLSSASTASQGFRFGFLGGFLVFAPQLAWFWKIFGPMAI